MNYYLAMVVNFVPALVIILIWIYFLKKVQGKMPPEVQRAKELADITRFDQYPIYSLFERYLVAFGLFVLIEDILRWGWQYRSTEITTINRYTIGLISVWAYWTRITSLRRKFGGNQE